MFAIWQKRRTGGFAKSSRSPKSLVRGWGMKSCAPIPGSGGARVGCNKKNTMLDYEFKESNLILKYEVENGNSDWVNNKLKSNEVISIRNTYKLEKIDLYHPIEEKISEDEIFQYSFVIGHVKNEYVELDQSIFGLSNRFYISTLINLESKFFTAHRNISIFRKIDTLISEDVFIGGSRNGAIPLKTWIELLKKFPNSYELDKYANARVSSILSEFVNPTRDFEGDFNKYMNKKIQSNVDEYSYVKLFKEIELIKYTTVQNRIKYLLDNEVDYSENQWQKEILSIILLIFPKYKYVYEEIKFKDAYSGKLRRLDFGLIDDLGHLDVVEIKKAFDKKIVTEGVYRDNYIPKRDLSGTIMQVEKYIYYLNKGGVDLEYKLTAKYKDIIGPNMNIKLRNPKGIIIMGRSHNLNNDQMSDFEIIKRKYSNILDIFTYDDLLSRIENSIYQLQNLD